MAGRVRTGEDFVLVVIERAVYRTRQFFRALTASLVGEDWGPVEEVLTPAQRALFARMSPADRRHGLAVYRALVAQGASAHDLLVAALLHDAGKAAVPFLLGVRVAVVLLGRFAPRLLERLSEGRGGPFTLYRHHAEIGAEWAARAGCSPLAVALIRHHERPVERPDSEEGRLLAQLQQVDESW